MALYADGDGGQPKIAYLPYAGPLGRPIGRTTGPNGGRPQTQPIVQAKPAARYYVPTAARRPLSALQRQTPAATRAATTGGRYEAFGITPDWMKAYKEFWGRPLPEKLWGLVNPITTLFTRYMQRLPQIDDWRRIWANIRDSAQTQGTTLQNMPQDLALYEPIIASMVRQPLFTPPDVTYSPTLNF